ncbi:MAG: nuclear transport factor 2 family protein [Sphingomonadaceae bacterium]
MHVRYVAPVLILCAAVPARAEWPPANQAVAEAAKHPRVAAVLEAINRVDAAIVAGDKDGFMAVFADDTVVNSPFNVVATREVAERAYASGALTYEYLRRSIEYAAPRGEDEVVLMGEETYAPPQGHPLGGKTVRRRFTDLWQLRDGQWKIALRQATVISAE